MVSERTDSGVLRESLAFRSHVKRGSHAGDWTTAVHQIIGQLGIDEATFSSLKWRKLPCAMPVSRQRFERHLVTCGAVPALDMIAYSGWPAAKKAARGFRDFTEAQRRRGRIESLDEVRKIADPGSWIVKRNRY